MPYYSLFFELTALSFLVIVDFFYVCSLPIWQQ
ncbi:hypothetical protein PG301_19310 [Parageobacillus sp. G301]|uniref:Uncharacterized protein n=1 Tax=Parageobacillus toebii NBRC 107807 TaxID=1223503 RepID=A0AA89P1Y7_9BACL|nr:hypothetical protein [Parageobacillus toebii NBRC 107807]GLH64092.1 hypothetical protein PG301_19310 [Parageobacillus sp. G301]